MRASDYVLAIKIGDFGTFAHIKIGDFGTFQAHKFGFFGIILNFANEKTSII